MLQDFINFFLHIDKHLRDVTAAYGGWTYFILFMIIFCETGLVVMPFLPGDSLLFAAGAIAAIPGAGINVLLLWVLLMLAAIAGDTVNYFLGVFVGRKLLTMNLPFVKQSYLDKTQEFYEKYGNKTIIIARFVPIVRTFAPFVAGIGKMHYGQFITYNVIGGVLWVTLMTFAGYLFGGIDFIQKNFGIVTIMIILISVLPLVYEFVKARRTPTPSAQV